MCCGCCVASCAGREDLGAIYTAMAARVLSTSGAPSGASPQALAKACLDTYHAVRQAPHPPPHSATRSLQQPDAHAMD